MGGAACLLGHPRVFYMWIYGGFLRRIARTRVLHSSGDEFYSGSMCIPHMVGKKYIPPLRDDEQSPYLISDIMGIDILHKRFDLLYNLSPHRPQENIVLFTPPAYAAAA